MFNYCLLILMVCLAFQVFVQAKRITEIERIQLAVVKVVEKLILG